MAQISDPREGFRRNKKLLSKVAAKAMARKGLKSKMGQFSRLGTQHGQMGRNLRPFSRPGNANRGGARPQGYGDVFDGMNRQGTGGYAGGYTNTAPVQAEIPDMYGQEANEAPQEYDPYAPAPAPAPNPDGWATPYTPSEQAALDSPLNQPGTDGLTPLQNTMIGSSPGATLADVIPGYQPLTQSAPSGQITAPGGLIPLGDGRYYDPATQMIHGRGRAMGVE